MKLVLLAIVLCLTVAACDPYDDDLCTINTDDASRLERAVGECQQTIGCVVSMDALLHLDDRLSGMQRYCRP